MEEELDLEVEGLKKIEEDQFEEYVREQKSVKKQMDINVKQLQYLSEYMTVLHYLDSTMNNLIQLLGSKNVADVTETIKLMLVLYRTNIERSDEGIRKMLVLIWSKEKTVVNEVIKTYWSLFLDKELFTNKVIAENLVMLLNRSTLSESTSLEEMLNSVTGKEVQYEEENNKKSVIHFEIGPVTPPPPPCYRLI